MRAVLLIILASLAPDCVSSTRTREVECFGSLMLEVWTSQEKLDLLEADWRTAWKARALTARQSPLCPPLLPTVATLRLCPCLQPGLKTGLLRKPIPAGWRTISTGGSSISGLGIVNRLTGIAGCPIVCRRGLTTTRCCTQHSARWRLHRLVRGNVRSVLWD
jgi:hypothetical protein